jgi:hypothetical protein
MSYQSRDDYQDSVFSKNFGSNIRLQIASGGIFAGQKSFPASNLISNFNFFKKFLPHFGHFWRLFFEETQRMCKMSKFKMQKLTLGSESRLKQISHKKASFF